MFAGLFETNEEKKKLTLENFNKNIFPQWIGFLEKRVGSNGFAVGDSLSIADLKIYNAFAGIAYGVPFFKDIPASSFDNAPNLKAIFGKVHSHPKVAEWNKNVNKY